MSNAEFCTSKTPGLVASDKRRAAEFPKAGNSALPAPRQSLRQGNPAVATVFASALVLVVTSSLWAQNRQSNRSAGPPDLPVLLHSAEEALNRKDFATAATALKSVVERQPDLVPAWFNLGYAYSGLHQNDEAVKAYQKALELKPDLFEARLNLGILLVELNKSEAALEQLAKAVALQPKHSRAHLYYGRALSLVDQAAEAEKQFQQTLALDPKLAVADFDLGQLKLKQERFDEALAAFKKAAELDAALPQAELGMALASEGLN
ncbi:MAG: hypothetical protein DMG26_21075, partial [Acidobacteria bacterium]